MLTGANGGALHLVRNALELWQLDAGGWVFRLRDISGDGER